jgi:hypothetical protein
MQSMMQLTSLSSPFSSPPHTWYGVSAKHSANSAQQLVCEQRWQQVSPVTSQVAGVPVTSSHSKAPPPPLPVVVLPVALLPPALAETVDVVALLPPELVAEVDDVLEVDDVVSSSSVSASGSPKLHPQTSRTEANEPQMPNPTSGFRFMRRSLPAPLRGVSFTRGQTPTMRSITDVYFPPGLLFHG